MDFDELKEDIRNIEYELEYGEEQHLGKIAVDVNCLRSVIDFANEAIARQLVTSEEVAEAVEVLECIYPSQKEIVTGEYPQVADALDLAITALQEYQPWNSISDPPLKSGKYLLYAPRFTYDGCEYSETLDMGLYDSEFGFSMPNAWPEPIITHWKKARKPHEVEL